MEKKLALNGTVKLAGSKSIINRVLLLAPFFKIPVRLENFFSSKDVETIVNNLQEFGISIQVSVGTAFIQPARQLKNKGQYFIQDSATALRFWLTRLALLPGLVSSLDVSQQLRERPHHQLIELLKSLGCKFDNADFPLLFTGTELTGGEVTVPVNISSQFVSALLLCSHDLKQDLLLRFKGDPVSLNYIDLTLNILSQFGIKAVRKADLISIPGGQKLDPPQLYKIEPDLSSACYFLALGAINDGNIIVNIPQESWQPDIHFLEILQQMGARITASRDSVKIKAAQLHGVDVDMSSMPDQVTTLVCLALLADSPSTIRGIEQLRYKESNRLQALLQELPKLGAHISYSNRKLYIEPLKKEPQPTRLNSYNDHRLVMSFTILSLIFPQIEVAGKAAVEKSFPDFFQILKKLN